MVTRDLTPDERTALDALWQAYLDGVPKCNTVADAVKLWDTYSQGYRAMGIIPTLAGYRAFDS